MDEMVLSKAAAAPPQVFRPWRRFFARMLDWWLYGRLWFVLQLLVLNRNAANWSNTLWGLIVDTVVQIGLLLALEPIFLSRWGTTPGKWLLGLRVTHKSGRLLTHAEALARTGQVLSRGMGFAIPIYDLVRQYKSYKICAAGERQVWDEDTAYTLRAESGKQIAAYLGTVLLVLGLLFLALGQAQLPKHRGELTPAQFADNVNRLNAYYDWLPGYILQEDGRWQGQGLQKGNVWVIQEPANFELTSTDGVVTQVAFSREVNADTLVGSDDQQMVLAILAFAGAPKDIHAWEAIYPSWLKEVSAFEDFSFTWGQTNIACTVKYSGYGYTESLELLWPQDGVPRHYELQFVLTRL